MPTNRWINPTVLRWARERLNLTPRQVAEESKKLAKHHFAALSEQELLAWERGTAEPELAHLETLSEIYACPVGWFFLEAPPDEKLPVSFRGLAKPREKLGSLSQRTLRRFMELAQWTVETLRSSELPWRVAIGPEQVAPNVADADRLAAEFRERLGWTAHVRQQFAGNPREAFKWWRRAIESLGVFCFEMPLDPNETRGAALWLEGYPFILVNHRDAEAAQGRIFTLLHELAHLVSASEGVVCDFHGARREHNPEPFANRFAARILVTPEELLKRLHEVGEIRHRTDWPDAMLDKLRKPFSASRDVVAILLQELKLAPPDFYERKRQQWEQQWQSRTPRGRGSGRPSLNEQKLQELGFSLARVLARSVETPSFSWLDTASVLGMKVEKTEAFLKWVAKHTG
jgi:Zn-dependent peptidase ImmA (M78 family)